MNLKISQFILTRMIEEDIRQAAIAAVLGVTPASLSRRLSGASYKWTAEDVLVLAEVFECEVADLLPPRRRGRTRSRLPRDAQRVRRRPLDPADLVGDPVVH